MPDSLTRDIPDGFVVVTIWTEASSRSASFAYEHYARLEDAAAHYRQPGQRFKPHGIFACKDGMPHGDPLDAATIASVIGGRPRLYGLREYQPNSPENMRYREDRHAERRPPGEPRGVPGVTYALPVGGKVMT